MKLNELGRQNSKQSINYRRLQSHLVLALKESIFHSSRFSGDEIVICVSAVPHQEQKFV